MIYDDPYIFIIFNMFLGSEKFILYYFQKNHAHLMGQVHFKYLDNKKLNKLLSCLFKYNIYILGQDLNFGPFVC